MQRFDTAHHHPLQLWLLSVGFGLIFLGFNTSQALLTTLKGSFGRWNLSLLYATSAVSSLFVPFFLSRLSRGAAFSAGGFPLVLFVLSCGFASSYLVITVASFAVGVCSPLLWSCAYDCIAKGVRDEGENNSIRRISALHNSVFNGVFQISIFLGLLLASSILSGISSSKAASLLFVGLGCISFIGVCLLLLFVRRNTSAHDDDDSRVPPHNIIGQNFLWRDSKIAGTIPLLCCTGAIIAFVNDDLPLTVSHVVGKQNVTSVLALFFLLNGVGSCFWGFLLKRGLLTRLSVMTISGIFQVIGLIFCLHAERKVPIKEDKHCVSSSCFLLLAGAGLLAVGDSAFESQGPSILQIALDDCGKRRAMLLDNKPSSDESNLDSEDNTNSVSLSAGMALLPLCRCAGMSGQFCFRGILQSFMFLKSTEKDRNLFLLTVVVVALSIYMCIVVVILLICKRSMKTNTLAVADS